MKKLKMCILDLELSLSVGNLPSPLHSKSLIAAQQRQKAFADQHRSEKVFSVGDQVLVSTKYLNIKHAETNRKLLPKWIGPFDSCRSWVP